MTTTHYEDDGDDSGREPLLKSALVKKIDDNYGESLLGNDAEGDDSEPLLESTLAKRILRNYTVFCVCFSVTMGAVNTVVSFASSDFKEYGNQSTGALFGSYCIVSLLFASPLLATFSPKRCLVGGMCQVYRSYTSLVWY
jgi:hypothetical protein